MKKGRKLTSEELIDIADGKTEVIAVSQSGYEISCVIRVESLEIAQQDIKNKYFDIYLHPEGEV